MRRVILLLSVGWLPPSLRPSGACLCRGSRGLSQPLHAAEGDTTPGLRLCRCTVVNRRRSWLNPRSLVGVRCYGTLAGHGPPAASQRTGHGHGHAMGGLAS
jgi:hypothetical protein